MPTFFSCMTSNVPLTLAGESLNHPDGIPCGLPGPLKRPLLISSAEAVKAVAHATMNTNIRCMFICRSFIFVNSLIDNDYGLAMPMVTVEPAIKPSGNVSM